MNWTPYLDVMAETIFNLDRSTPIFAALAEGIIDKWIADGYIFPKYKNAHLVTLIRCDMESTFSMWKGLRFHGDAPVDEFAHFIVDLTKSYKRELRRFDMRNHITDSALLDVTDI